MKKGIADFSGQDQDPAGAGRADTGRGGAPAGDIAGRGECLGDGAIGPVHTLRGGTGKEIRRFYGLSARHGGHGNDLGKRAFAKAGDGADGDHRVFQKGVSARRGRRPANTGGSDRSVGAAMML